MYCSLHSCKSLARGCDGQSLQPHPICATLDPPQTFPASQSPQENTKNDKSEYSSLAPLVFHLPSVSLSQDLVFGHDTKGPRVGRCEGQNQVVGVWPGAGLQCVQVVSVGPGGGACRAWLHS